MIGGIMSLSELANRIVELENLNANLTRQLEQACEERDEVRKTYAALRKTLELSEIGWNQ
jgi:hypothetical protein